MNDVQRLDTAQLLLMGADFQWGDEKSAVVCIAIPAGVRINGDIRRFLDDATVAIQRTPPVLP